MESFAALGILPDSEVFLYPGANSNPVTQISKARMK